MIWSWLVKLLAPASVTVPVVDFTTLAEPARIPETVPARRSNACVEVSEPVEPAIVPDRRETVLTVSSKLAMLNVPPSTIRAEASRRTPAAPRTRLPAVTVVPLS